MSALLSFTIANNGGYTITSYYYSIDGTSYTSFTPISPTNNSYLIPDLINGTTYPVTMFSSNDIGASPVSISSNVTPGTNPTAPFITSLTLGNLSAVLNFTVSDIGGYAITSYYYNLNGGAYINFGSLNNPYTITGLSNGTTYSVTIKASNAIGISGSSTSSNVKPGIPPSIPITTVVLSNMSALLSFTIANNGGYAITSYYYSIDGSIYTSFTPISPTNNSYLIPDLINGTTYPVTMFSSNDIGASPVSTSSNVTPGTNPTAPFITSLTLGNLSAVLNFTVSDIGGYAITSYYYNLNGGAYINFGSLNNPYTITGLSNGTTYSVTIKASNAIGISGSSASSNVKPGAPPNPPSFVSLVPGISQASFTFTPGNSNGYAIQSYYYSLGGSYILFSPSGNAFTITGLINSNYTVTLQASNAIGISAASVESNVRPYTLPSAPTFTISRSGSNFNIAYSIADTGGCNLTTYSYNVNSGSYITSAISGNSFIITSNVSSNVQYTIGLYVTSTAGNSLAISNTFAAVPPTLIATGTSTLYVSLDNISWLRQTSPANINLTSVVWTGSNWIGVGNGTFTSIISSDGISWSNGLNTLPSANTIAWNPVDKYAVAGVRGANANPDAYITRDGKSWTNPSFPMSNAGSKSDSGNGIAWNGLSWMIVGRSGGGSHIGALSLNGIDWTVVNSFSSNNISGSEFGTGYGVAWNGTSWSVVGQNSKNNNLPVGFSSNNASNWILSNPFSSTGVLLRGVAWNPRDLYWVVVGYNSGNTISASKSTDGINWTTSSPFPGGQGRSILWTGSNWIATGTTGIAISTDGVNWSTISGISDSINSIVSSNPTLIVGASPSAPTITSIQSGDYQLTVTFTPGASNGYSIQEYYYSIGESYISTSSLANTFTISNLAYGNYAVTLKALSFAGLSLASTPSNGRPFSAPSISIASLSVSDSSAILGFTVDTAGYAVSEYYYNLNGGSYIPFTPSGNSYIIPNLTNGSTYSVTLKALNSLGLSSASSASNVKPGAVPIAPSFVSLVEGKNQATLTLTPGNSNGYAIQSYYYSLGGSYILFSPVSNSFTITGLIYSNYTVTLKSSNAIGISLASEASNVIPYTNPTAPVISVSRATSNLNVTYSVISTGGCNLTSYSYSLDGGSYTTSEISGNSFTFSNLIDNIQYIIRMYVTNFAGTSPVSSNVFAAVPPTLIATGTSTLYVSLDSITWLKQPHPTNITLSSVVWTGSNWIGVGSGTFTSIISSNGTIWTNGLNVIPSANAIAWNPLDKYGVAAVRGVSVNGDAYITRDGKTWTNPSFPMSNTNAKSQSASGIAWNGSSWMIVGRTFAGTHTAALSLNGINWTPVNSFSSNGMSGSEFGTAFGVAWNGTSWLVVGQNTQNNNLPAGISSNNGTNWVLSHPFSSTGTLLQGVAWNSRDLYWVVVGYNTGNTISAAKSSDGINWTSSTPFPGGQGAAILWTGSIWYATGTTGMATSTDGVNWTTISGITDSITSIVSSNSTLIQ
jgi:titin